MDAVRHGSRLEIGNAQKFGPTKSCILAMLLTRVEDSNRLAREEIFGPVVSVMTPFNDDDVHAAVRRGNVIHGGLAAYVYGNKMQQPSMRSAMRRWTRRAWRSARASRVIWLTGRAPTTRSAPTTRGWTGWAFWRRWRRSWISRLSSPRVKTGRCSTARCAWSFGSACVRCWSVVRAGRRCHTDSCCRCCRCSSRGKKKADTGWHRCRCAGCGWRRGRDRY